MKVTIVVVQSTGRLGNRLEQFTHLIALARDHGVRIANPAFSLYAEFFEHTGRDLLCRYPPQRAAWVTRRAPRLAYYILRACAALRLLRFVPRSTWIDHPWDAGEFDLADPAFLALLATRRFIFLTGTWQHRYWKNLAAHLPAAREHFRLTPALRERVARHFAPIRAAGDIVVGVHLRQGDYAGHLGGAYFWGSAAYARVMHRLAALFPGKRAAFLVCSDAPQSAADFPGLTVFFGPGDFIGDLYALAECDYLVGPAISSFSAWASLMGEKPRLALRDPDAALHLADFAVCKGAE
jgi:hypothetical protein